MRASEERGDDRVLLHDSRRRSLGNHASLVEQNVAMALEIAKRAYVLEEGRIVAEGKAQELMARPEIGRAYLGWVNTPA